MASRASALGPGVGLGALREQAQRHLARAAGRALETSLLALVNYQPVASRALTHDDKLLIPEATASLLTPRAVRHVTCGQARRGHSTGQAKRRPRRAWRWDMRRVSITARDTARHTAIPCPGKECSGLLHTCHCHYKCRTASNCQDLQRF